MAAKVAQRNDLRDSVIEGGVSPVVNSREIFARIFCVSCSFVPTYSGHRIIRLAFEEISYLPGRRSGPPGLVVEFRHGFFPGKRSAVLDKRFLPVTRFLVAAGVDELLELFIRHLMPIHPVVWDLDWWEIVEAFELEANSSAWNSNHPFGNGSIRG